MGERTVDALEWTLTSSPRQEVTPELSTRILGPRGGSLKAKRLRAHVGASGWQT